MARTETPAQIAAAAKIVERYLAAGGKDSIVVIEMNEVPAR